MNKRAPFQRADLDEFGELLDDADQVVAMEDIHDGNTNTRTIGLRHDLDNEIICAVRLAEWEAERGYRASYYVLHTEDYWTRPQFTRQLAAIAECGHEIGFHLNAITAAIEHGGDPLDIAQDAVDELRAYGYPVRGVVAHGAKACYTHHFVNDEIFTESRRIGYGQADRVVGGVKLAPVSRADLGFDYDAAWLHKDIYLSDSGGQWSQPFEETAARFRETGQLHILTHPCWWTESFSLVANR